MFEKYINTVRKVFYPVSENEDKKRQEFILNILLVAAIGVFFVAFSINFIEWFIGLSNPMSAFFVLMFLFFLVMLLFLSRKGFFYAASYLLLSTFLALVLYMNYRWGVDLPSTILLNALIIVMSGILISSRFAFISTGIISVTMIAVDFLQRSQVISMNRYWRSEPWTQTDTVMTIVIFGVIATVSWLSNREIEKSLTRARKSEANLKDERDSLEIKVEQRTKELKEVQAEKMVQLYRFAEFGRISSGLFHDLINPLNAVSLNLGKTAGTVEETKEYVANAVRAAKKLEDLVVAVRKQLAREETKTLFSVEEEIKYVIEVLSHKALKANVELQFRPGSDVKMFGDAIKFNQIVLNLIVNGIDAFMPPTAESAPVSLGDRWVRVFLIAEPETIIMLVEDNGVGIPEHHIDKIFEPFFTTKVNGQGIGIGLSMAKRIVEKDFEGSLIAKSEAGRGSTFKVSLPVRK